MARPVYLSGSVCDSRRQYRGSQTVELFGLTATLGNILYGSVFLRPTSSMKDTERKKRKSRFNRFFILITLTLVMQGALLFKPHPEDIAQPALETIFGFLPRVALGSLLAYIISQTLDVYVYSGIRRLFPSDRALWLRNSGSTALSQLLDTLILRASRLWALIRWMYGFRFYHDIRLEIRCSRIRSAVRLCR
ncbi:queuosine precursor transporter [Bacillus licheniformis]|nr:queuosine precursor transporter [Bacillus licheniformis]